MTYYKESKRLTLFSKEVMWMDEHWVMLLMYKKTDIKQKESSYLYLV